MKNFFKSRSAKKSQFGVSKTLFFRSKVIFSKPNHRFRWKALFEDKKTWERVTWELTFKCNHQFEPSLSLPLILSLTHSQAAHSPSSYCLFHFEALICWPAFYTHSLFSFSISHSHTFSEFSLTLSLLSLTQYLSLPLTTDSLFFSHSQKQDLAIFSASLSTK